MKYFTFLFVLFCNIAFAQSPIGLWKTVDDESGNATAHFEIFERDGKLYGKVIKLLEGATTKICIDCPGDKKNKDLIGMELLSGLKPYKDYYSYGQIIDPKDGKVYKCNIWLDNDVLKVRGYIGFSLIGRTQNWYKLN